MRCGLRTVVSRYRRRTGEPARQAWVVHDEHTQKD